jgi:phosphatidylserine/phosphatidylglycerophosphate/cardiolipin synthase-like enzyme
MSARDIPGLAPVFAWDDLGRYKREGRFLEAYPENMRRFWSPGDDIPGLLAALLKSARQSVIVSMYGYDSPELDAIIREKLSSEHVFVQMSLDKTQAAGKAEKAILAEWQHDGIGNSVAVGTSSKGAISHVKMLIVDATYVVSGSTNWSGGGMLKQDNELLLCMDATVAGDVRARLDIIHTTMLQQQAARLATSP